MRLKYAWLTILSVLTATGAYADEAVIGGSFVQQSLSAGTTTIINASTNVNGLHVRTMLLACSTSSTVIVVPPWTGAVARAIAGCSNGGVENFPYPIFLPAGYALEVTVNSGSGSVYMSYDLNGMS